jgi:molecular chaperone GrpE
LKSLLDRDAILRRFETWLDEALAIESPPSGIPAEILDGEPPASGGLDLYAVQAALTALTQEIRLQGRSFKQLSEAVAPVAEMAPSLEELVEETRQEAEHRARREVLDALLNIRDRLARGEEMARQAVQSLEPSGWRARLIGRDMARARETLSAVAEGYALTAGYTDEVLERFGVREIHCLDELFDPHSMDAVGTEPAADAEDGTVVEVYRRGYEWNGEVYRPAQVKVARSVAGQESQ